jgi:hypothetical protein
MSAWQRRHPDAIALTQAITPPEPVFRPDLDLNDAMFKKLRNGIYIFRMVVDREGRVADPLFLRGPSGGGEAYLLWLLARYRYKPALKDGKPVSVVLTITWNLCG